MKRSSKSKPGDIFSPEGIWEIYFDFFDLCFPELEVFSLIEINPDLILLLYDDQRTIIPRIRWLNMDFKEKILMKIGLIHKVLDGR